MWGGIGRWVLEEPLQRGSQGTLRSSAWGWPCGCNILKGQGLDRDNFLVGAKQDSYMTEVHRNLGTWHLLVLFPILAQSRRCCRNIRLFPAPLDWLSLWSFCPSLFPPLKHLLLQGSAQALCMAEASSTPPPPKNSISTLPLLCSHNNLGITYVIILKLHICFFSPPNSKLSSPWCPQTQQCFCCNLGGSIKVCWTELSLVYIPSNIAMF